MRWYNDLYLYSLQEDRWTLVTCKASSQLPKPRSGMQLSIFNTEDVLYMYGGYSKEKAPGVKNEGIIHDDMWFINLKPLVGGAAAASGKIDTSRVNWQRVSKKGHAPSRRCGASMVVYKNKGVLFGGVLDEEGPRHSLISTFYNDLYAFDMERRRWYQLGASSLTYSLTHSLAHPIILR